MRLIKGLFGKFRDPRTKKLRHATSLLVPSFVLIFYFQNCGLVKTPQVENQSSIAATWDHTGAETSCASCHEKDRPTTNVGFIGLITATPFDYSTHGRGYDCFACHDNQTTVTRTWADWAGGVFTHPANLTSCQGCHEAQRYVGTINGFDHTLAGVGDCFGCHQASLNSAFSSMSDWSGAVGLPSQLKWNPSLDLTVTEGLPTYSGSTVNLITSASATIHGAMNHQTTQLPAATLSNCATCHSGAATGIYFPGVFHQSLAAAGIAQPTACADCHSTFQPVGFVGPVNSSRTPTSAAMKHNAVAWAVASGASAPSPTTSALVTVDCATCHVAPQVSTLAASWAVNNKTGSGPAVFHASLANAQSTQPASCLDCHANSRPPQANDPLTSANTAASGGLPSGVTFYHYRDAAITNNCASCHVNQSATPTQYTSWAYGKFHTAGSAAPNTCLPCHSNERPTSTTNWQSLGYTSKPFDYTTNAAGFTHGGGLDCVNCHNGPGTGAWGGTQNWQGGNFVHISGGALNTNAANNCKTCHSNQRPDIFLGASTAATLLGFDHSTSGAGECSGCHQATITRGSFSTYFSNPATANSTDWQGALSYPGSNLVGTGGPGETITTTEYVLNQTGSLYSSINSMSVTLMDQMQHTSVAIPAAMAPSAPSTNCNYCHASGLTNGNFHASVTTASQSQPTKHCADCHVNTKPTNVVEHSASDLQPMDHSATFNSAVTLTVNGASTSVSGVAQMDCSNCHHSPGVTPNGWVDGIFHANIGAAVPSNCALCHYPTMVDTAIADKTDGLSNKMVHGSSQMTMQNCQNCHASALGRATTTPYTGPLWSGGAFHASLASQPTSCTDCHTGNKPSSLTVSAHDSQHMNHSTSLVATECASCHLGDTGLSPRQWSQSDYYHTSMPSPASCQICHGLTNGGGSVAGTNNDLPAGLTTTNHPTTSTVGTGLYDQINHTNANIANKECNICHTQIGTVLGAGMSSPPWRNGLFHANVPTLAGGTRCDACHLNLKPTVVVNGMDHSTIGTQDCSSCHSIPGTGTQASPNWLGAVGAAPATVTVSPPTGTSWPTITSAHPTINTANAGESCTTCHGSSAVAGSLLRFDHGFTLKDINTGTVVGCFYCHGSGQKVVAGTAGIMTGPLSTSGGVTTHKGYSTTGLGGPLNSANCSDCHQHSGTTVPSTWNGSTWTGGGFTGL